MDEKDEYYLHHCLDIDLWIELQERTKNYLKESIRLNNIINDAISYINKEYKNIDVYDRWIIDELKYILEGSDSNDNNRE